MNNECLSNLRFLDGGPAEMFKNLLKPESREFMHPGDLDTIHAIMRTSEQYYNIEKFIEDINVAPETSKTGKDAKEALESSDETSKELHHGVYMKAFGLGLTNVLEKYVHELSKLEDKFLGNAQFSLTCILAMVKKFETLFFTLNRMINAIRVEGIYGCLLIARLHPYHICGIPELEEATKKIVLPINQVFCRQLASWIVFGCIKDVCQEFFISDCQCFDEDFLYEWEINANTESPQRNWTNKDSYKVQKFQVCVNMVPSVMQHELAETILFIGQMVRILQTDPRAAVKRNIWSNEEDAHIREICKLENEPFCKQRFEEKIVAYRATISKCIWRIMVEEANLLKHLQMIRDYYCLGRGELFQHFIMEAEIQLPKIRNDFLIRNLNFVFADVARKIYSSSEESYTKFELVVPVDVKLDEFQKHPLANLELYFRIEWPLHIIFRPRVLALFNKVFCFLMRVKKTHIDLHRVWAKHKESRERIERSVWSVRNKLMFLVNNLLYYLQVDVIEAQFSILIEAIKNANEYSDIVRLHSVFVSNLLSQSFVISINETTPNASQFNVLQMPDIDFDTKPKVYNIIIYLLKLCDTYCDLALMWGATLLPPEQIQLEKIEENLDTILERMFRAMYSFHEKVAGSHLQQLLQRLDFNRWYTKGKLDLSISSNK